MSILRHDNENQIINDLSIENRILSETGLNNLNNLIVCSGQNNCVYYDALHLEQDDVNNIVDGAEINLFFTNEVIAGETTRNVFDTNANSLKTIFEADKHGIYLMMCYIHLDVSFGSTGTTGGTFYSGKLNMYLNDTLYTWVSQKNLAVYADAGAVNHSDGCYDINLVVPVALHKSDKVYFSFQAGYNILWTSAKVSDYEVWGNFGAAHVSCDYNLNTVSTDVYKET